LEGASSLQSSGSAGQWYADFKELIKRGDVKKHLASPSGGAEMGNASSGAERGDDDDAVYLALANACGKYDSGWSGCLDLKKPREDPRAKNVGGDISIDESAAAADGHRFREEQHANCRERNRSPEAQRSYCPPS
jgi:hypothetical protein